MKDLEISRELKDDLVSNQNLLKKAIRNHQNVLAKLNEDPDNTDLQRKIRDAEIEVIYVGLDQKSLLARIREEHTRNEKSRKNNLIQTNIESKRCNLTNALNRARKQNIVTRPTSVSVSSISEDSVEAASVHSSPEHITFQPVDPHDICQSDFLNVVGLVTHDVFKEMQNKRVERKRRSTANPHFLYGNKGWDFHPKRKRSNNYLYSTVSPPNTRQAVRKKNERVSPTTVTNGTTTKSAFAPFPSIPNLPSGLTIERVSPTTSSSPDSKSCVTCKHSGSLAICDSCANGFHVSCHNRPFATSPRQCPRCFVKEVRTVGALNVPSGMSVSYITPSDVEEKMEEKKELEDANKSLSAELTQLQDKHSQLTISLKNQKSQQEELLMTQHSTEDKIKQILAFISNIKSAAAAPQ